MEPTNPRLFAESRRAATAARVFGIACFCGGVAGLAVLDALTATLLLLTTFLFAIVCRFAERYMAGDPRQKHLSRWLCLTGASVLTLVLANNLLLFAAAWCATGLGLHQLLQTYPERRQAVLAARKKFLISRLGDLLLIAALVLVYREFGTSDFAALSRAGGGAEPIAILVALAAVVKSAQFPFHTWLPDTMETPTPVSALMHAGIINAGGILVLRMAPVLSASQTAMSILCVAGAVTAVLASVVMLTQASVKRCLAFSTVAQMGFMMLELGLGAFHLALLHLVAHSLYKAHAFLASGGVAGRAPSNPERQVPLSALLAGSAAAVAMVFAASPDSPLLAGIFAVALAQMLWSLFSAGSAGRAAIGLLTGCAATALYYGLDHAATALVRPAGSVTPHPAALLFVVTLILLAVAQARLPFLSSRSPLARALYVHARNGFYLNTIANRITAAIWPLQHSTEGLPNS